MQQGYAISDRDYTRIENAIRFVERNTQILLRRRHPIFNGGLGGEGLSMLDDRVEITDATPSILVKATHENKWLFCNNADTTYGGTPLTVNKTLILPPSPSKRDRYTFMCVNNGSVDVFIYPNTGQTLILPAAVLTAAQYVDLDNGGIGANMCFLEVVCKAANTWICCGATHSRFGP